MAKVAQITLKWNQSTLNRLQRNVTQGLIKMGYAIANQAQRNAPVDTGALVNSIRVNTDGDDNVYVLAGGVVGGRSVPYALKREYENNKNPGTKLYMTRAFQQETKDYLKYFRGITK